MEGCGPVKEMHASGALILSRKKNEVKDRMLHFGVLFYEKGHGIKNSYYYAILNTDFSGAESRETLILQGFSALHLFCAEVLFAKMVPKWCPHLMPPLAGL